MRAAVLSIMVALAGLTGTLGAGAEEPAATGCGAQVPKPGLYPLRHGDVDRVYALRLPAGYDGHKPTRLVLAFHMWSGDEREFADQPTVVAESSRRNYILVAPRGLGSGEPDKRYNGWSFRGSSTGVVGEGKDAAPICDVSRSQDYRYPSCRNSGTAVNVCAWTHCQDDDVAFVADLVAHLEKTLCVDPAHVYAVGGFTGGMFVWELGQNERTAPLFRAIASIAGIPHRGDLRGPGRREPLPALLITGRGDKRVPAGGWDDPHFTTSSDNTERTYWTGATAITRRFAEVDGCPVTAKERPFDAGHAQADCRTYCPASAGDWPTVLDCRAGMGHEYGIDWSWKLVLDFFDRK
jgi:hypothetical protein